MADEDKLHKAALQKDIKNAEKLTLQVAKDGLEPVSFKVKRSTPFSKIFDAFCAHTNLDRQGLRFVFDGKRLKDTSTPADFEMEESDTIDCFVEAEGGSRRM
mmetsp:Transcript_6288/g.11922  ORF Transcript_6288/g.11922 Transcript_6288/m.11922 type:complete len:102 (+) Transcript_6288:31-336(+)|eukprot:CAMPEP_0175145866 /NCGR_PEP_ID=MMETSP0087-20121206/15033_1 /TAXON_ID=136419 /ORGANISM="Unknown Unknown, Strain D1" /LENGTH=101 /DNA_ID=CAMNT_0016430709 /DNA_START=37 /DNA_END=342 /DNA_ORIENTATION=+